MSKGNGFTYGSNNHTIQWMPEQPNRLKGVKGEICFLGEEYLCRHSGEVAEGEAIYEPDAGH